MLSICIVSWNVSKLLEECLFSIYKYPPKSDFEIIVVDNDSKDDSVKMVQNKFPRVKIIKNTANLGFSIANNQAIKNACGSYILILNPDTEILGNSLAIMTDFLNKNTSAGAVAPKILNPDQTLQKSCLGFPTLGAMAARQSFIEFLLPWNYYSKKYLMLDFDYDRISEVDQPMGACILLRKKTLDEIGLFDEKSFMFFDEVDLCFRIKKAGWKIFFTPDAKIIHHGGSSIKKWSRLSLSRNWTRSRNLFFRKHYGILAVAILYAVDLLRIILIFFILWILYKSISIFLSFASFLIINKSNS